MEPVRLGQGADAVVAMQIRAARALLAWTQAELAERSGVATRSISDIEAGFRFPRSDTLERLMTVFEEAGIELIDQEGRVGAVRTGQSRVDAH